MFASEVQASGNERAAAAAEGPQKPILLSNITTVIDDRLDVDVPFRPDMISRLLRSIVITSDTKSIRPVLRLLSTCMRYKRSRLAVLQALVALLKRDGLWLRLALDSIPGSFVASGAAAAGTLSAAGGSPSSLEADVTFLLRHVESPFSIALVRRLVFTLQYVIMKTKKLVWLDIVRQVGPAPAVVSLAVPESDASDADRPEKRPRLSSLVSSGLSDATSPNRWIFGALLELLDLKQGANGGFDSLLLLIEEVVSPFLKLSQEDVAFLLLRQAEGGVGEAVPKGVIPIPTPAAAAAASISASSSSSSSCCSSSGSSSHQEQEVKEQHAPAPQHVIHTLSPLSDIQSFFSSNPASVLLPFPVLTQREAAILTAVAASEECGTVQRRKTHKIMRCLSLADANWHLLLQHLSDCGAQLAAAATAEINDLHNMLRRVVEQSGDALFAMAQPALATPSSVSELRLLHVLRLMMEMRSKAKQTDADGAAIEAPPSANNAYDDVVNDYIKRIDFGNLWENLCDCLDLVRGLEGIEEEDEDEDEADETAAGGGGDKTKKTTTLSSLTMRFVPLVECFLTVSNTLLQTPAAAAASTAASAAAAMVPGSSAKRDRDGALLHPTPSTSLRLAPNVPLPGARFRTSTNFLSTQIDLPSDAAATRLFRFAQKNHVLLNMILKNNISLLETSFAPLITLQRCRCLLHFDIKRGYFKMKLRRIRLTSQRNSHGSLRITVRRRDVFQDSFEQLRYKTTEEMRRRLIVTFVGEEGIDAGGLTREWYGVLAREIFNPNYGLFIGAGDSVTFQPNPASGLVNSDWHLSYFKFVGRVIGKAICDGHLLDAHFTRSFYKHILGLPVTVLDLEAIDPEYYKTLKMIQDVPLEDLGLDLVFTAESNDFGEVKVVELVPGGRDMPVTDNNKSEYIKLISHHRMTSAIKQQVRPNIVSLFSLLLSSPLACPAFTVKKQLPSSV
jgi:hypothetical protein